MYVTLVFPPAPTGAVKLMRECVRAIDAFSIRAVAQDDFEDVTVPDTPSPMPHTASASTGPAITTTTTPVSDAVLNKRAETSR